jgi:hypothetical protein
MTALVSTVALYRKPVCGHFPLPSLLPAQVFILLAGGGGPLVPALPLPPAVLPGTDDSSESPALDVPLLEVSDSEADDSDDSESEDSPEEPGSEDILSSGFFTLFAAIVSS